MSEVEGDLPAKLLPLIDSLFIRKLKKDAAMSFLRDIPSSKSLLYHLQDRDRARKLAETLAGTHLPSRALRTLIVAHNLGTNLKQSAYECVVHRLVEKKHWGLALSTIRLGKLQAGRTTVRLLNWRALSLIHISNFKLLDNMLMEFEEEGLQPNRRTFHLLLSGHIRNRDLEKAKIYMTKMQAAGFPIDGSTHALVVSVYRSLGPDVVVQQRAFDALGEIGDRAATIVLNSLIQFALDANNLPAALDYLSLFTESRDADKNDRRAIFPDPATFTMMINHVAKEGNLHQLSTIFSKMRSFNVQPDTILLATVIRALYAVDDVAGAVGIVASICKKPHKTTTDLLSMLGLNSEARRFDIPIIYPNISPDVQIFNSLMKGAAKTRGIKGIRIVLKLMNAYGVFPDSITLDTLVMHLRKNERSTPDTLAWTIENLISRSVRPSMVQMHSILTAVIKHEKHDLSGISGVLDRFDTGGEVGEALDSAADIKSSKSSIYPRTLRRITRFLTSRGLKGDRFTFSLRLRQAAAQDDVESAEAALKRMLDRGIHPNAYHYVSLTQAYANAGNMTAAENIFQTAIRAQIKPTAMMYTVLIVGYGRQRMVTKAMYMFKDMVARGIEPDVPAIHALANAFYVTGLRHVARTVLVDLWSAQGSFPAELRKRGFIVIARAFRAAFEGLRHKELFSDRTQPRMRKKLLTLINTWRSLLSSPTWRYVRMKRRKLIQTI